MQKPLPLQVKLPAHSLSGSVPAATKPQTPGEPPVLALEQARHKPVQLELQQLPSTQLPLADCVPVEQTCPLASRHLPELQV